jgi:RNA polymerase sigma-70 factor (ECF subfamily)
MDAEHADLDGPADFDETFREHYWPMVRSLSVACGDREAAADAVQDAFTRAYARWRRISRYEHPAGWVRHVALNRLRDHFRHEARGVRARERIAGQTVTTVEAPETPDVELMAAVSSLPPQQQIAVSLFYVEQLSVREIATSMKLSEGAVKYHLHAGRSALRARLGAGTETEVEAG